MKKSISLLIGFIALMGASCSSVTKEPEYPEQLSRSGAVEIKFKADSLFSSIGGLVVMQDTQQVAYLRGADSIYYCKDIALTPSVTVTTKLVYDSLYTNQSECSIKLEYSFFICCVDENDIVTGPYVSTSDLWESGAGENNYQLILDIVKDNYSNSWTITKEGVQSDL